MNLTSGMTNGEMTAQFSRSSFRESPGNGRRRLTLVIHPKQSKITVQWCLSKRKKWKDAKCDLRCRERTTLENIGKMDVTNPDSAKMDVKDPDFAEIAQVISAWARTKNLDFVVWTALKSNFKKETKMDFSPPNAVAWVQSLSPEGKAMAAEYIWNARDIVQTPVRSALQQEPWFSKPTSYASCVRVIQRIGDHLNERRSPYHRRSQSSLFAMPCPSLGLDLDGD